MYENSDENIGNLEEGDLSIEVANHSQSIFTLIKNSNFSILNVFYHKCKKKPNELLF